jgi:hypothetical protein
LPRTAHLDQPVGDWPAAPWGWTGAAASLPSPGCSAWGYPELLSRPQTDRVVLRAGRPIGTAPPDYHELDGAFKGGPMGDISGQVAGLISSVLLALVGYLWTFYSTRITQRREAQLKRLDEQLRILYGPLYALSGASEAAWNSFMAKFAPEAGVFIKPDRPPTEEELSIWRSWITTVILPMNEEMEAGPIALGPRGERGNSAVADPVGRPHHCLSLGHRALEAIRFPGMPLGRRLPEGVQCVDPQAAR